MGIRPRTHVFRRAHCSNVQRVVIAFKHGVREIIEACFAAMALLALAIRMVCLSSATDPLIRRAMRALHPFGPAPLAYGFITSFVGEKGLNAYPRGGHVPTPGIYAKRDSLVSARYSEELNSGKNFAIHQRTDRHGVLGQKPSDFQLSL